MKNILLFLPFILISCGVVPLKKTTHTNTTSVIALGAIGKYDSNIINKQFHVQALPLMQKKVRVASFLKLFDKSSSKTYNAYYNEKQKIKINDTLNLPPNYFLLTIMDKVTMLQELNSLNNIEVFNFLKTSNESSLVTTIAIRFPIEIQEKIINAEELFLVNNKSKKLVLELYVNDKLSNVISFSDGSVFDYKTSNFCWSEKDQRQIIISDISENSCTKKTYKSYAKALKKKKEFKY